MKAYSITAELCFGDYVYSFIVKIINIICQVYSFTDAVYVLGYLLARQLLLYVCFCGMLTVTE